MVYLINVMKTIEQLNRVTVAAKVDPAILAAIETLAREEERTVSNTIERLLKESPRVAEILTSQALGRAV